MYVSFIALEQFLKNEILLSNPAVTLYVLYNNFFYILIYFVFTLQEDFYGVQNNTNTFYFLLLQKDTSFTNILLPFVFFFFRKNFDTFHQTFLEISLYISHNIQLTFLYSYFKKILTDFLYALKILLILIIFHVVLSQKDHKGSSKLLSLLEFFFISTLTIKIIRIFFIRTIRRNFCIITNIFRHLFFFKNIFTFF